MAEGLVRFPDFFVVGAPRCGTTALCRYLSKHPAICFSKPKETHYFTLLGADWRPERLERDYLRRFFPHLHAGHRLVGEGSVSYLYSVGAIERIVRLNPQARMVALVRNPIDVLPSYHLRMLYVLAEDVEDFPTAWALQDARARGERVPRTCPDARLLLYRELVRFGAQIERLYEIAGRERCLVLCFEDLAADPLRVYRQTLDFLGVEYDGRVQFARKLPSRRYRYRLLQRLFYSPPKPARAALERVLLHSKQRKKPGRRSLLKRLAHWNTINAQPVPLGPALRADVRASIAEDVELLGMLLGRDFSHWLTDEPAVARMPATTAYPLHSGPNASFPVAPGAVR
jgi:hypothetical protein